MRGGHRPGAGRKPGVSARNAEEARRVLSEMVMREIEPIGKALILKAKQGDISAARELLDRAFGKPVQLNLEKLEHKLQLINPDAMQRSLNAVYGDTVRLTSK